MRTCIECNQKFATSASYWTHFTNHMGPGTLCKGPEELETWGFDWTEDGWKTWFESHSPGWSEERFVWSSLFRPVLMYEELFPVPKIQTPKPCTWWKRLLLRC